jgi:transposase-like protein
MQASIPSTNRKSEATNQAYLVDRKLDVVMKGMRSHRPVRELCREVGISPTSYYHWQQQVLDAARTGLAHPASESDALKERIRQLEAENTNLRRQVNILTELCVQD